MLAVEVLAERIEAPAGAQLVDELGDGAPPLVTISGGKLVVDLPRAARRSIDLLIRERSETHLY